MSKYSFLEIIGLMCLAAAVAACVINLTGSQFGAGLIMGLAIWEAANR